MCDTTFISTYTEYRVDRFKEDRLVVLCSPQNVRFHSPDEKEKKEMATCCRTNFVTIIID